MSSSRKISRAAKVRALAKRPGSPGEQAAAEAALERLSAVSVDTKVPTGGSRGTHLSDAIVKRLTPPAKGNKVTWDDEVPGFGARITAAGAKAFVYNYRTKGTGQQRRVTIGQFPSWSTSAARTKAKELRRLVDSGADPRGDLEEERSASTMADLIERFKDEYLPRRRPATIKAYRGMLAKHIGPHFGQFAKVSDVTYSYIDALHRRVTATGSTYIANRCVAVCSKMFSLAILWGMRTDNPAKGVERNSEIKRKRYLSGDELKRLMAALASHADKQFADIIRLLLLTGARKTEVLSMRWDNLTLAKDKGVWSKPGSATKQKVDHITPLSAPAVLLLKGIERRGDFVFPGCGATGHIVEIKKGWASLCKSAGIKGLRIHDLRHSFASQLVSSGASLPLIGALLGHSNPSTTARYSHLVDDVQRAAVEKIGEIVGGRDE